MSEDREPHVLPPRSARLIACLAVVLLIAVVGDWLALKSQAVDHPRWVLALLVGLLVVSLLLWILVLAVSMLRQRDGWTSRLGRLLVLVGLVTVFAAGLLNWLLALQGFVVLLEGETVPLHGGSHQQAFTKGPLASLEELDVLLTLREVELVTGGDGRSFPRSHLLLQSAGGEPVLASADPGSSARLGQLRLYQGAFGFAPRIVVARDGGTVFDRVVPFTTERGGPAGVSFAGRFTVAADDLEVEGSVDLSSLDEGMRGHATLHLTVWQGGDLIGRGQLLPGHFAEIERRYRVGFAGLEKWSEVDISRRSYPEAMLSGLGLSVVGGLLWFVGRWGGR